MKKIRLACFQSIQDTTHSLLSQQNDLNCSSTNINTIVFNTSERRGMSADFDQQRQTVVDLNLGGALFSETSP